MAEKQRASSSHPRRSSRPRTDHAHANSMTSSVLKSYKEDAALLAQFAGPNVQSGVTSLSELQGLGASPATSYPIRNQFGETTHTDMWPHPFQSQSHPQNLDVYDHSYQLPQGRGIGGPQAGLSSSYTGTASTSRLPPQGYNSPVASSEDGETPANAEDKRRRNTAASARFRVKKKQKAINLERTVAELTVLHDELDKEAALLRSENGFLKEIVMMKGTRMSQNIEAYNVPEVGSQSRLDSDCAGDSSSSEEKQSFGRGVERDKAKVAFKKKGKKKTTE